MAAARIDAIKTAIMAMSQDVEEAIEKSRGYAIAAEKLMERIDVLEGMIK